MIFVTPTVFTSPPAYEAAPSAVSPRTEAAASGGAIILESDDANIGDFLWHQVITREGNRRSQFHPFDTLPAAVFCPMVNTAYVGGGANKLNGGHLAIMAAAGHEIGSHGRHHYGAGEYATTAPVSSGATVIPVLGAGQFDKSGTYTYRIWSGATEETISVTNTSGSADALVAGTITINAGLTNAYPAGALIQMTTASLTTLLQGAHDDLLAFGLAGEHHAFPWHNSNAASRAIAAAIFGSYRWADGVTFVEAGVVLEHYGFDTNSEADILAKLDEVAATGSIVVLNGHGETDDALRSKLRALVRGCRARGVAMLTRSQAAARLAA